VIPVFLPPLYAIVDPLDTGAHPLDLADAMLAGGARLLQLRLKHASTRDVLDVALALRQRTRAAGALLIINDRPDIARAVEADGVHLGQDDVPVRVARAMLPSAALVGVSTHDEHELAAALAADPDYVAVGPIFATDSKRGALPPRGLALVVSARRRSTCPLVAIGGITAATAATIRHAGADSVAMIAGLVRATDVCEATRAAVAAASV
jgi:thiamine-phosphate pyrophosphorylase